MTTTPENKNPKEEIELNEAIKARMSYSWFGASLLSSSNGAREVKEVKNLKELEDNG